MYCDLHCSILPTTYSNGGVARSAVDGNFSGWDTTIAGEVTVWDKSADGYRGRAWVNIYWGCWCVSAEYRVRAWAFDAAGGAGTSTTHPWPTFNNPYQGGDDYYTVEVKIGRYDGDTGAYGVDENQTQRFYLTLD